MVISEKTQIMDLAFLVATTLEKAGIKATLVGGAAASYYCDGRYLTPDLDFVSHHSIKQIDEALEPLGFLRQTDRYYRHDDTNIILEFPAGPLAIGNHLLKETQSIKLDGKTLNILTPTQSVMDRLAWFFFQTDRQSLDLAVLIAQSKPVDLKFIENWANEEGELEKFKIFKSKL
jgi:hypothetical protein